MNRLAQKQQTRLNLLERAYEEFAVKGFFAAKTLDIAKSAGVSHGTLFLHYPTKEELLSHTIDQFGLKLSAKLKKIKGSAREVLSAHLDAISECESFYTHLVVEGPLLPPYLRSKVFMIQSGIAFHLQKNPFIINSWLGLIHYYLTHRDLFAPAGSVIKLHGKDLLENFIQTHNL